MSESVKKHNESENEETGFNEAELQDIMSEIENLEKEFSDSPLESSGEGVELSMVEDSLKVAPEFVEKTDLQKQIDEEMSASFDNQLTEADTSEAELSMDHVDTEMMEADEILGEVDVEDVADLESNVIDMNSIAKPRVSSSAPVSLACEGNMTMSMSFKLGDGEVKLSVNGDQGVTLSFSGVEVHMTESEGCVVEMNNGVKFQIPLSEVKSKKNVA